MKNGHRNKPRHRRNTPGPFRDPATGHVVKPCFACWIESGALVDSIGWIGPNMLERPVCRRHAPDWMRREVPS